VQVDGASGNSGLSGDVVQRGFVVPPALDQGPGSIQNPPGSFLPLVVCSPALLWHDVSPFLIYD
jgi:hypothetical protein